MGRAWAQLSGCIWLLALKHMSDTQSQCGIMPFMMSLDESLRLSKNKFQRRTGMGSKDDSTSPSVILLSESTQLTPLSTASTEDSSHVVGSDRSMSPNTAIEKPSDTWAAIRALLTILESSTDAFGPLKSAISGLKGLLDIYEQAEGDITKSKGPYRATDRAYNNKECKADSRANKTGRRLMDVMEGSDGIMECYRCIDGHLRRIAVSLGRTIIYHHDQCSIAQREYGCPGVKESQLNRMLLYTSAIYNSAESLDVQRGSCTSGTREAELNELIEWASVPGAGKICWMNGMAGTGKTTIACTVCSRLDKSNQLGASFFCSRVIPGCRQVQHIIPSIASQLASFSRPFQCALAKVLEEDCDAHTRPLSIQYQKLIIDPLKAVEISLPKDLIVVIDALDECESVTAIEQILELLLSTTHRLPIRFLLSSRPEREITEKMTGRPNGQDEARLVLHNLDSNTVKADIGTYMREELKGVPLKDSEWTSIIDRCGVSFIYASTVCRYIKNAYKIQTFSKAVKVVIDSGSTSMGNGDERTIDELYKTILDNVFKESELTKANQRTIRAILEMVVCIREPMSLDAMAGLLRLDSVEEVDTDRSDHYYCNLNTWNTTMAEACLKLIDATKPRFNICRLPSSFLLDKQVDDLDQRVAQSISPGLVYACRYWTAHLSLGEESGSLTELVGGFFESKLLMWMEVMNLTKNMRYATPIIQTSIQQRNVPEHMTKLAHDASQFVSTYANHPLSQSTPHIYASMLPFWPRSRPLSAAYMPRISGLVQPTGTAIDRRRRAPIATWKVSTSGVMSIGLSRDGRRLAAPSADSINLYDTTTGESMLNLTEERTKNVYYVAISPDGSKVAFCTSDSAPYLWDTANEGTVTELLPDGMSGGRSLAFSPDGSHVACGLRKGEVYICTLGQEVSSHGPLRGHTTFVTSVMFSSDGLYLVSGSKDKIVRVWDVQAGQPVCTPFEGHIASVWSVCYCLTDSRVASGSSDKTIRVWDPQTGKTVLGPLTGHSNGVSCVAFLHNGALIASGSSDRTIRVYETHTGHTVLGPLEGHTSCINSIIFSPESTHLFSCSEDGTVRVWNIQDLHTPDAVTTTPSMPLPICSIRYSHSGTRVVSGLKDGSIHVWDVATSQLVLGPLHGHDRGVSSIDYSGDDRYIASGSGTTLRIWNGLTGQDMHGPMEGHDDFVNCVRFSPDSTVVVSGSYDCTVRIWDVNTGQQVGQLFNRASPILSVGISSDGHRVACGSIDDNIAILDRHSGTTLVGPIDAHKSCVSSVEFSPDGTHLVSGSYDESVKIWDAETGEQVIACGESGGVHSALVSSVSFSPNGLYVASGSDDHTVRVWDSQNGKLIYGPLKGHTSGVECIQFSPDGSHLVSCSEDCTIRFWDLSFLGTPLQEDTSIGANNAGVAASASDSHLSHLSSLDGDGWVVDSHGRRLVWVPSDLRTYLALPPTSSIIAEQGGFILNTDGWNIGDRWTEC
ncbi:peptidase C14 [Rhizoctonia solani AG-1 IA]|uniref:Peptidase C14 n=1 Tax=Thanatephorus cucumeris (strain AG1-IA) TaxID=983506 RepID=L8WJI4_THACA|nr:peptidase C14 [Rhizoctonia solani AG-1 IA]